MAEPAELGVQQVHIEQLEAIVLHDSIAAAVVVLILFLHEQSWDIANGNLVLWHVGLTAVFNIDLEAYEVILKLRTVCG